MLSSFPPFIVLMISLVCQPLTAWIEPYVIGIDCEPRSRLLDRDRGSEGITANPPTTVTEVSTTAQRKVMHTRNFSS